MSDVMMMRYAGVSHVNDMINSDKLQKFLGDEDKNLVNEEPHVTTILTSLNNDKGP